MKNKEQHQFDEIFKNGLEHNTPTPSFENWKNIATELEGESFDSFVKNHLEEVQPTPNPKIWNGIKRKLPLSLLVKNQLNWLSRIAAVLVIFMVVLLIWNKDKEIPTIIENEPIAEEVISETTTPKEPVDFVFSINENAGENTISASEELFLEDDKTNEDLWSDVIVEEEEDLMVDVNGDIIDKSLEEILALPIESLEAVVTNFENQFSDVFLENESSFNEK